MSPAVFMRLEIFREGSPAGRESVDSLGDGVVLDERRRVMRLNASVDDEWSRAAPVLSFREGAYAIDIRRRIGPRERHPEKVVERAGCEVAVIDDDNERRLGLGQSPMSKVQS